MKMKTILFTSLIFTSMTVNATSMSGDQRGLYKSLQQRQAPPFSNPSKPRPQGLFDFGELTAKFPVQRSKKSAPFTPPKRVSTLPAQKILETFRREGPALAPQRKLQALFSNLDAPGRLKRQCWDKVEEVPVPAAAWLFGTGLITLAGVTRKKRQVS